MLKNKSGFTLVELLVVMAILGVLVTIVATGFRSSQARGRDAQRKSDLKQISSALELFYADYGMYPSATSGQIAGCDYDPVSPGACDWGESEFSDGKTIYFKKMPIDPSVGYEYLYRIVDSPKNQKYQLFARLENSEDQDCINNACTNPPVNYSCGVETCNFSATSTNTDWDE